MLFVKKFISFSQICTALLCMQLTNCENVGQISDISDYQNDYGYSHGGGNNNYDSNNAVHDEFYKAKTYKVSSYKVPASYSSSSSYSSSGSGSLNGNIPASYSSSSSYSSSNTKSSSGYDSSDGLYDLDFNPSQMNSEHNPGAYEFKSFTQKQYSGDKSALVTQCSIVTNNCVSKCIANYQFPNGETKLKIGCEMGEWVLEKLDWTDKLACEPICMPPCKNNGICIKPGMCSCPENFVGPYCEHEKKLCLTRPIVPHNSKLVCSSTSCSITCAKGYSFPDGTSITNMICKDGEWAPSRTEQKFIPDCQPTCSPPCENAGKCLSYNVCECPKDFRGKQCQYNVDVCSPKKLNFNGAYTCSGDNESFKCKLKCPDGVAFTNDPEPEYVCAYERGFFIPTFVPQCNYSADMEVIRGAESAHSFSTLNRTIVMDGSASGGKKVKKVRKKKYHKYNVDGGDDEDDVYEEIITKTKIIKKKGKKKSKAKDGYESFEEYEEHDDTEAINGMREIGVYSLYMSSDLMVKHRTPKAATCITWNGNKIKTFDGLIYNHNLRCAHTLIQDRIDGTFSVALRACSSTPKQQQQQQQQQQTCAHSIDITMANTKYSIEKLNNTIVLWKDNTQLSIPIQVMGLRITKVGLNYKIHMELIGLTIIWDTERMIHLETTAGLFNRTASLCGTLDQNVRNEFMSKDGNVHSTTMTFVDAWQLPDAHCNDEMQNTESMELVCVDDVKSKATEICNKLLSNTKFENCLTVRKINNVIRIDSVADDGVLNFKVNFLNSTLSVRLVRNSLPSLFINLKYGLIEISRLFPEPLHIIKKLKYGVSQ